MLKSFCGGDDDVERTQRPGRQLRQNGLFKFGDRIKPWIFGGARCEVDFAAAIKSK